MGFLVAERNAGQLAGLGQYGVAVGEARQGGCVEGGKGVEGVAADVGTHGRGEDEVVVEGGIVAHQHGPFAIVVFHGLADRAEDFTQAFALGYGFPLRIPGVNAGEVQGGLFQVGAFKGVNLLYVGFSAAQPAIVVHSQDNGRHFQQSVPLGVEAGGLHIHNNRQKAAETAGHGVRWFVFVSHSSSGLGRV